MKVGKVETRTPLEDDRRAGLVLVLVLWVLVVAAVLALSLAQNTRLDNAVRVTVSDRVTARWLGRAGVYQAISAIAADKNPTDFEGDIWYDNEEIFHDQALPGGSFSVYADRFKGDKTCAWGVVDEASKLNLNTATREALLALPGMNDTLADNIIDWRKQREQRLGGLARFNYSTGPSNQPGSEQKVLATVRELGLVPGMTQELLYAEDANFNGILEDNENDGPRTLPPDNQDGVLERGLLSYVTVYSFEYNRDGQGRKRININTADRETLLNELGLSIGQVKWILFHRPKIFTSIADLLDDTAISVGQAITDSDDEPMVAIDLNTLRRIADRITVRDDETIPGRININTAGRVVLQTLPHVNEQLAERIIQYRKGLPEGFTSIAELLLMPELTINHFKKLAELITVRSNVFTVRSLGLAARTGLKHYLEAVVARVDQGGLSVIYWKESR